MLFWCLFFMDLQMAQSILIFSSFFFCGSGLFNAKQSENDTQRGFRE